MGETNGIAFGHAAVLVINTQFAREAQRLRRYIGSASYPIASVAVYFKRRTFAVEIVERDRSERFDALEVAFINSPVAGGALEIKIQVATIQDGLLHVAVVQDLDLRAILRDLPRALRWHAMNVYGVHTSSLREATIRTDVPMPITLDGEECLRTSADVRLLPGALRVFVPRRMTASNA